MPASYGFPSKLKQRKYADIKALNRSPTAGRTPAEHMRILRACDRFHDNIQVLLDLTEERSMPWFPTKDVVTDRDDEAIIDWRAVAERFKVDGYQIDGDGLLIHMQDPGITASNRIEVVTVYSAHDDLDNRDYMLRKTVYSPFPCDRWGALPLTMHQWRIIALAISEARARWQWEAALNEYAEKNGLPAGYRFAYIAGWNLVENRAPFNRHQPHLVRVASNEPKLWTGTIMFRLATTGSFSPTTHSDGGPE